MNPAVICVFFQYLEFTLFPRIMGIVILQPPDELRTILENFIKILFMFASGEPFAKVYVYNFMFPNNFGVDF